MITESWVWRRDLVRYSERISSVIEFKYWRSDTLNLLERDIFLGFFSIRKLIESGSKVSREVPSMKVRGLRYASLRPMGDWQRWEFYKHYDMKRPRRCDFTVGYLCNQMIHSLLLSISYDEQSKIQGLYFVSDLDKNKFCNEISLTSVSKLFMDVAKSEATRFRILTGPDGVKSLIAQD